MELLTKNQRKVYEEIEQAISSGSMTPTLRELCSRFRWASTGSARDYVDALVRKGYLIPAGGRARGYRLANKQRPPQIVPLLGEVPAGVPIDAIELMESEIPVPAPVVPASASFALRVKGDSMIGAGIEPGDIVFVRKQEDADPGQIVVARVDGEVTVKRLKRQRGHLALVPENPAYKPILVGSGTEVVGVVVGLARGYDNRTARV